MNGNIIVALLGLFAATLCSAVELLPATEYIDVTNLEVNPKIYRRAFGDFVEKYGSDDPDVTTSKVGELAHNLEQLLNSSISAEDKFGYRSQMDNGHLFSFNQLVQTTHNITTHPDTYFTEFNFSQFLSIVIEYFGQDLWGFAKGEANHDLKLQAYLLKSLKSVLSNKIAESVKVDTYDRLFEHGVQRMIAHDLKPGYTEAELISKAQSMDLLNGEFDARSMLKAIEGIDYAKLGLRRPKSSAERLVKTVEDVCSGLRIVYGGPLSVYIWARLLMPEELAGLTPAANLHRLTEYWRVCMPVNNQHTRAAVFENLKENLVRSLKLKERIKKMF